MSEAPQYEDFGPYRLTHLLGKGGMASVYRAVKSGPMGFAKEVAIKRIHDSLVENEGMVKGLVNEARIGGQLKHPNIVEIYEFNKVDQTYFLAMEFVDGWTLDRLVKLSREFKMPIPPAVVLEIGRQICEGLDYAHKLESLDGQKVQLVHRDLKPANIIVSRHGIAKLMDFGIAKAATNLFHTTLADVTKGTPHYMSPEQVAGDKDLSFSSDLFAIGAVLYELATNRVLFKGDSLATVLFNVVRAEVEPQIAETDQRIPGLAPLMTRLLAKAPSERPKDAAEVVHALSRLLDESYANGPTIRQYLYSIRDRMLLGSGKVSAGHEDVTVADETRPSVDAGGEPEFATLLAPAQRPEPAANEGLAEARAAADAEIGAVGVVFAGSGALQVDTGGATVESIGSLVEEAGRAAQLGPATARRAPAAPTDPNVKATRQVAGPTRKMRRKKGWSAPMLVAAAVLALVLASTVGWIVRTALREPAAEAEVVEPPTAAPIADLTFEPTKPTEPATASRPEPATPRVVEAVTPKPATEPPTAARVVEPEPQTPAPVAVVSVKAGIGTLSIKKSEPYARVYIDGIDTGKTTPMLRFTIPAGTHVVELEAVELQKKSKPRSFTLDADENLKLGHYEFQTGIWSD